MSCCTPGGGGAPVEVRVSASSDDAEERSPSNVSLSSSDLEMVFDGGSDQKIGLRFNGVAVPRGAAITNAWVQFTADEIQSEATSLLIQAQAIDNAPTFSAADNISDRTRTTAAKIWNPVPWSTTGEAGLEQRTPNLATVVQEVVDRQGWSSGNSIAILITGTGHRTAVAYDGSPTESPLLHIELQASSSGTCLFYQSNIVDIPADANHCGLPNCSVANACCGDFPTEPLPDSNQLVLFVVTAYNSAGESSTEHGDNHITICP